ncbi:hypothetical protein [Alicyclobacillus fastidiosus]|uniref:Uncharacterized protein n=1 Tax=Alicyclobacillus fastidiosus TaxID=392011 RepID=A0ABV5AJQ9_9BACL|nr:hypothetical protein [Alicyclobacillus fastidiosus]WEH08386.1 hypothetical protein PYS47_17045 [Alicyclobacillus fastidiosus]
MFKSLYLVLSIWVLAILGTSFYGMRYLWFKHEAEVAYVLQGQSEGPHGTAQLIQAAEVLPHLQRWFASLIVLSFAAFALMLMCKRHKVKL